MNASVKIGVMIERSNTSMHQLLFKRLSIAEILGITTTIAFVSAAPHFLFFAILLFAFVSPLFLGIAWAGSSRSTFRVCYRQWIAFCGSVSLAAIPSYGVVGIGLFFFSLASVVAYIPLFTSD